MIAWVGADERPAFIEQTRALAEAWSAAGTTTMAHIEPPRRHFDVIEDLERADSPMIERWLGD